MPLTDAGITHITQATIGEAVTAFSNANAYLGVGDSNTAFSAAQTDLVAATNKDRQPMEATYPSRSGLVVTARSVWQTGEANWTWEEWGFFNAASSGTMLVREVTSLGTKTSAQSWQLTVDITFDNP